MINVYIPTYNSKLDLITSVKSAEKLNVVVIDNNSESEYDELLNSLKDKITVIKNPYNLGRVGNWAACVEHFKNSDAEWMKWLFTGDTLEEDAKEKMEEAISLYPEAKIITFYYTINLNENNSVEIKNYSKSSLMYPEEALKKSVLMGNWFSVPIASMVHKDAIKNNYSFGDDAWVADFQFGINIVKNCPMACITENIGTFNACSRKYFMKYKDTIWAKMQDYCIRRQALDKFLECSKEEKIYNTLEINLKNMFLEDINKYNNSKNEMEVILEDVRKKVDVINQKFEDKDSVNCIIWGAGGGGIHVKNILEANSTNYKVKAFIDIYKSGKIEGIDVIKPTEINKYNPDYIFISTTPGKYYAEEFLKDLGLKKLEDFIILF